MRDQPSLPPPSTSHNNDEDDYHVQIQTRIQIRTQIHKCKYSIQKLRFNHYVVVGLRMMDDTINKDQKDYQISVSKVYPVWNEKLPNVVQ